MPKWVLLVFAFTTAMVLLASGAVAESAPSVSECDLCLGVAEENPYVCLGNVSAITTDEEDIYVRIRLEGPLYESHEMTARWIDPSGELYFEDTSTVPSPSSEGYGWWNYYVTWFWIDIAGWPASEMLGEWRVDVFVDGEERCTKRFTINLSKEEADSIAEAVRYCFGEGWTEFVGDVPMLVRIVVAPEAAGFHYGFYYSTEAPYGDPAPAFHDHRWTLECSGELDESGAAAIEIPWPGDEETYYFQVLIATNPLEFLGGSFWPSTVVRVDRPPEEEPLAASGLDHPIEHSGSDYIFGCSSELPRAGEPDIEFQHSEDCFVLQLSPAGLVAGSGSPVDVTFGGEGFVTVTPTDDPYDGEIGYVVFLPVDLPLRPCCEKLELTELSFCYQSLASEDMIESVQIGYLSDTGSFEELAVVEGDLASLTWDFASVRFSDVVVLRPLVIRFWFGFGGAAPFAAGGGMRLGNIRAVLAPRGPWSGRSSPGNITCAKLLTCFPSGPDFFGPDISCADGIQYVDFHPGQPQVIVYFWSHCDESITCEGWKVLDEVGDDVWTGGWVVRTAPAPEDGYYEWGEQDYYLGECFLPGEGDYEVVLQTSLGEFRKKFSIDFPD